MSGFKNGPPVAQIYTLPVINDTLESAKLADSTTGKRDKAKVFSIF